MEQQSHDHDHDVTWARGIAAVLCAVVIGGFLTFGVGQREAHELSTGAWDPIADADLAVAVRDRELVPAVPPSQAVEKPAEDMLQVGEQGGVALWAERSTAAGGGGGSETGGYEGPATGPDGLTVAPADRIERGAWGTLFVRLRDGRFVPLADRVRVPQRMERPDRAAAP